MEEKLRFSGKTEWYQDKLYKASEKKISYAKLHRCKLDEFSAVEKSKIRANILLWGQQTMTSRFKDFGTKVIRP